MYQQLLPHRHWCAGLGLDQVTEETMISSGLNAVGLLAQVMRQKLIWNINNVEVGMSCCGVEVKHGLKHCEFTCG